RMKILAWSRKCMASPLPAIAAKRQRPGSGTRVTRLVKPDLASAGQGDAGRPAPAGAERLGTGCSGVGQPGHFRIEVVAHQIEMVDVVIFTAMHAQLGGRQLVDQPASAAVDAWNSDDIAQETPGAILVTRKDHDMRTADHCRSPQASPTIPLISPTASSRTASRLRPLAAAISPPARLSPMAINTRPTVHRANRPCS